MSPHSDSAIDLVFGTNDMENKDEKQSSKISEREEDNVNAAELAHAGETVQSAVFEIGNAGDFLSQGYDPKALSLEEPQPSEALTKPEPSSSPDSTLDQDLSHFSFGAGNATAASPSKEVHNSVTIPSLELPGGDFSASEQDQYTQLVVNSVSSSFAMEANKTMESRGDANEPAAFFPTQEVRSASDGSTHSLPPLLAGEGEQRFDGQFVGKSNEDEESMDSNADLDALIHGQMKDIKSQFDITGTPKESPIQSQPKSNSPILLSNRNKFTKYMFGVIPVFATAASIFMFDPEFKVILEFLRMTPQHSEITTTPIVVPKNTKTLAAKPLLEEEEEEEELDETEVESDGEPILPIVFGKNARNFERLEKSLDIGDPKQAIEAFNVPLSSDLNSPIDKLMGNIFKLRYFMLVGKTHKANEVLGKSCGLIAADNALLCLHALRVHVASKNWTENRSLLSQYKAFDLPEEAQKILLLAQAVTNVFDTPNEQTYLKLIENSLVPLPNEWARERSYWLAKAFFLSRPEHRPTFANTLLVNQQSKLKSLLAQSVKSVANGSDPLLVPFVKWLGQEFDIVVPDLNSIGPFFENNSHRIAVLLSSINRSTKVPSTETMSSLLVLSSHKFFYEIYRLVELNLKSSDRNVSAVQASLKSRLGYSGKFKSEWSINGARFALQTKNINDIKSAVKMMFLLPSKSPDCLLEFQYWFLLIQLQRQLQQDFSASLRRLKSVATTPNEIGTVLAFEALESFGRGQTGGAMENIIKANNKYPHHPIILDTAAELSAKLNVSAERFLALYIPPGRLQQTVPPLSKSALKSVFESLE